MRGKVTKNVFKYFLLNNLLYASIFASLSILGFAYYLFNNYFSPAYKLGTGAAIFTIGFYIAWVLGNLMNLLRFKYEFADGYLIITRPYLFSYTFRLPYKDINLVFIVQDFVEKKLNLAHVQLSAKFTTVPLFMSDDFLTRNIIIFPVMNLTDAEELQKQIQSRSGLQEASGFSKPKQLVEYPSVAFRDSKNLPPKPSEARTEQGSAKT
ncbi:MAG: PH domain-containing protein [bacterium]|nr:PH domain-containing protein [bacterium]